MEEYTTIQGPAQAEFVERRSRFIGHLQPAATEEEAVAFINRCKSDYWDASHNVYAYLLREGQTRRYSDDGEPQGTGGVPVLEVLQREGLVDVVCVVTRYFGGILLGAGGLVRAYTQSAKDALDAAGISVVRRWVETLVPCPYSLLERLKSETAAWGGVIPETEYGADVTLTVLLPEEKAEAYLAHILDMTAGTVEGIATGERFQDVPWRSAGGAGGPG